MANTPLSRRVYLFLFAVALALRAVVLFAGPWADPGRAWMGDSGRYLLLADNLRLYHTFGMAQEEGPPWSGLAKLRAANGTLPGPDANGLRPDSFRTPGYPFFIAAIQTLTGDVRAVLVVQCILGALLACLVAGIAAALGIPRHGALAAGLLWAFHPGLITFDLVFMTECLFNICVVAGLFVATRSRSALGFAVAGLLIGAAGLVRPLGLLYLPAALALVWPNARSRLAAGGLVALLAVVPSALWAARNYTVGEGYRVSWVGDATSLFYFASYPISEERGEDWLGAWPRRNQELLARLGQRIEPGDDVFTQARRLAAEEMRARPTAVARVLAKSQVKLYLDHSLPVLCDLLGIPYQSSNLFARLGLGQQVAAEIKSPALLAVALGWVLLNVAIVLAALVGLGRALKRRSYQLLIVCGLTMTLFMVATMSQGLERFRMPVMLPLVLLIGSLWGVRSSQSKEQESRDREGALGRLTAESLQSPRSCAGRSSAPRLSASPEPRPRRLPVK